MQERCGAEFWNSTSRNFWHMAEISATSIFWPKFLVFPKCFPKWAKLSFSSLKHVKNTPDHIFISIFGQKCSFRSFWVCWRARAPYRSEKRSRSKISQNGPKIRKMSFWFQKGVKKWFWFYKIILQLILIIYNPYLGLRISIYSGVIRGVKEFLKGGGL